MGFKIDKREGFMVSLTTIVAVVASVLSSVPIAQRVLAGEIKEQLAPMSDAFIVILIQQIQNQRNSVTAMEFKRDMCGGNFSCWTLRDAQDLQSSKDSLRAMEQALTNMQAAKR